MTENTDSPPVDGATKPQRNTGHPVWDVYDLYRTARLNVKYYSCRVSTLQRQNFWIEFVLAATAAGSAIAGLTFWSAGVGRIIWQMLMIIAAVLAVAKPLLKLTDRIQTLAELVGKYRAVEYDLKKIEVAIRQRRKFEPDLREMFVATLDRMAEIAKEKNGEFRVREKLRKKCRLEVEKELPASRFFIPEESV
ncbi:MAG TPA: hypothetical protein VES88_12375 [Gemmatimonadaceae bacterium]|nr:hypothetical protein [Gemmatimonadaceae bacterium]